MIRRANERSDATPRRADVPDWISLYGDNAYGLRAEDFAEAFTF